MLQFASVVVSSQSDRLPPGAQGTVVDAIAGPQLQPSHLPPGLPSEASIDAATAQTTQFAGLSTAMGGPCAAESAIPESPTKTMLLQESKRPSWGQRLHPRQQFRICRAPGCGKGELTVRPEAWIRCHRCQLAAYCSPDCRRAAWHHGHKLECRKLDGTLDVERRVRLMRTVRDAVTVIQTSPDLQAVYQSMYRAGGRGRGRGVVVLHVAVPLLTSTTTMTVTADQLQQRTTVLEALESTLEQFVPDAAKRSVVKARIEETNVRDPAAAAAASRKDDSARSALGRWLLLFVSAKAADDCVADQVYLFVPSQDR